MAHEIMLDELRDPKSVYDFCVASSDPIFVSDGGNERVVLMNFSSYRKTLAKLQVFQSLEDGERDVAAGRETDAFAMLDRLETRSRV